MAMPNEKSVSEASGTYQIGWLNLIKMDFFKVQMFLFVEFCHMEASWNLVRGFQVPPAPLCTTAC